MNHTLGLVYSEKGQMPNVVEHDLGSLGQNQVRCSVLAASINHRDIWIIKGKYANIQVGCILGSDATVQYQEQKYIINPAVAWGTNEGFQSPKFSIIGMPTNGTFAHHIHVDKNALYEKPEYLTDEEAAALPLAGLTAYRALVTKCSPKAGEVLVVSGIGGGVAQFAAQFGKAMGLKVFVTSGDDEKLEKAKALGFEGVNYRSENWEKTLLAMTGGVDIVIDAAGGEGFSKLVQCCHFGARLCFYGGTAGNIQNLSPQTIFWKQMSIFGSTMGSDKDFSQMLAFCNTHKIKPIIDHSYSLTQFNEAYERIEKSKQFGKIILKP